MRKFKASNIMCQNCANTVKNALKDEFGEVEVDVKDGVVSLNVDDKNLDKFYEEMEDLGFKVTSEI